MVSHRIERVNQLLRDEISSLISREMKDPRLTGMLSVTSVETTPDLRSAKVYISILASEDERQAALAALQRAAGFFRKGLGARLSLRHTPELTFHLDLSLERGDRIMRLLREIEREPGES